MNLNRVDEFYHDFLESEYFNEDFKDELSKIKTKEEETAFIKDKILSVAKIMGYNDLSVEDIRNYNESKLHALGEEELENVAGGRGIFMPAVTSMFAALMLCSTASAAKPADRMEQRAVNQSNYVSEVVAGSPANAHLEFANNIAAVTSQQFDLLRAEYEEEGLIDHSSLRAKAYLSADDVGSVAKSETKGQILYQSALAKSNAGYKCSPQQLAALYCKDNGISLDDSAALICANAQYKGGRGLTSTSQEEAVLAASLNLWGFITGSNSEVARYYADGRAQVDLPKGADGVQAYNARNALFVRGTQFVSDDSLELAQGFRMGVKADSVKSVSASNTFKTNVLFHAGPDSAQTGGKEAKLREYFKQEFEHILDVCQKEGIKCISMSMFGTGSFIAEGGEYDGAKARAIWSEVLEDVFKKKDTGVTVIVADGSPSVKLDKDAAVATQKQKLQDMINVVKEKYPALYEAKYRELDAYLKLPIDQLPAPDKVEIPKGLEKWGI